MIDEENYYSIGMMMGMIVVSLFAFVLGSFAGISWYDNYLADIARPIVYPKSVDCEAHKNIYAQELIEALIKEVNHARQTNG